MELMDSSQCGNLGCIFRFNLFTHSSLRRPKVVLFESFHHYVLAPCWLGGRSFALPGRLRHVDHAPGLAELGTEGRILLHSRVVSALGHLAIG